ncbi:MAG: carbon-nitrogen hydrolase [Planctomycetota bacterium]
MTRSVRLGLIQLADTGSKQQSLDKTMEWIRKAANDGADIVCLQELFATCYPCQSEDHAMFDLAEPVPGPTSEALAALAKELQVVIVAPLFERRAPGLHHNSAVVLDVDGSIAGLYRKMHIPDDPLYYEKFYFTPGDAHPAGHGFGVVDTAHGKLGVAICWDQWFPETARLLTLAGADLLLYPTAIGWIDQEKAEFGATQHDAWMTMIRSHAIANGIYVGTPNRVGIEDRIEFWGSSFIAGPTGEVLARGSHDAEQIVMADCSPVQLAAVRNHWPFLRDRRIDAYEGMTRRWIDEPSMED